MSCDAFGGRGEGLIGVECQASGPNAPTCYASAPNDVWGLGVILVNLATGRNPWKRASSEDATYRAYLQDPRFLSSILPISGELEAILRRIFQRDPTRRIGLPELREQILACASFAAPPAYAAPRRGPTVAAAAPCAGDDYAVRSPPATPPRTLSLEDLGPDAHSDVSSVSSMSDYASPPTPPGTDAAFVIPPPQTFYYQPSMDWKPTVAAGSSLLPSVACY